MSPAEILAGTIRPVLDHLAREHRVPAGPAAEAMLLAIGMQESRFQHRDQVVSGKAPGQAVLARTDGSTNGLTALIRGTAATPVTTFLALADTPASYAGQGGRILRVNAGATAVEFGPRHNLTASAAPTATDDSAAGYSVGSQWLDTVGAKIWFCTDATAGAAVWKGVTIA